jgi:uncharacterized membrane protein
MFNALAVFLASETGGLIRRYTVAIGLYALAAVLALMALGFALFATYDWLQFSMSSISASFLIAGVLAAFAIALAIAASVTRNRRKRRSTATVTAIAAAPIAARLARSRVGLGTALVVGVVALGALAGRKIGQ